MQESTSLCVPIGPVGLTSPILEFILLFDYILREPDAIRKMMLAVRFPVRNTVMVPASLQGRVVLGMVQMVEVDRIPSCLPVRWESSELQQKHLV